MTGLVIALAAAAHAQELRFANIGDLKIGYRTYGRLAADKSNAIVVLTWLGGTSEGLASWIGPGNLYDSSKYYLIVVDALGDGVSSSPSNSNLTHITIRDMVRSQYELLTRVLKLDHVYAVSGLSMGGIQTFQWVVSYPNFMTKAIPIAGTPKQTAYDLLLWKTELSLVESLGMKAAADINEMHLHTPAYIASHTKDVDAVMKSHEDALRKIDPRDYATVLGAMIGHDIGSIEAVRAKMLVVVAQQDHMVNPAPAEEFARATKSELLVLTGDCGHLATQCEKEKLIPAVARFLAEP
ncbi:MAG TPA: alpha/beta hydrolase [Thermoanaerobaculia bacterium]|nr:alpha/beta hydrolase [Thermoanaerobaculia bacterium]